MEKTVLTKEEITQLSSLQEQQNDFVIQLGQTEYQINLLERQKISIKQYIWVPKIYISKNSCANRNI